MEITFIEDTVDSQIEVWQGDTIIIDITEYTNPSHSAPYRAKAILDAPKNLQLLTALETAQKELDPTFQTREELLTQLTELLNKANG